MKYKQKYIQAKNGGSAFNPFRLNDTLTRQKTAAAKAAEDAAKAAEDAAKRSKIDTIFPNALLDGYLFDPHGYSVNAILPKGHYFTIHITPEPNCSYVNLNKSLSFN